MTWFWRLREIFDGQKTKGDRLPLENMLEGLISQVADGQRQKMLEPGFYLQNMPVNEMKRKDQLSFPFQMPQTCDAYFSTEITNHLFQKNARR